MKRTTTAQWMNLHRNNSFVNWMRLPWLCEKSEAILLVLVGLTAGSSARRQSDEILVDSKILTDCIVRIFMVFNVIVLPMHFSQLFRVKYTVRRVMEAHKSGTPCFSCRCTYTTVLNDGSLWFVPLYSNIIITFLK